MGDAFTDNTLEDRSEKCQYRETNESQILDGRNMVQNQDHTQHLYIQLHLRKPVTNP